MKNLNSVVIVGRINVGKSRLFNRLTEKQQAIVSEIPGTTRDRNTGIVWWRGKTFSLVDTGGVNIEQLKNSIQLLTEKQKDGQESIEVNIIRQTKIALKEAKLILFLVDGKEGMLPDDRKLALVLKKIKKPLLLVCNKIDNNRLVHQADEFYKLGLGQPIPVSASTGFGTGDLLDLIFKKVRGKAAQKEDEPTRVAIIGKPNVGKSSLINKITGEYRSIVSPIPQTTREPQDIVLTYKDEKIKFIDTAGIRKTARIKPQGLEDKAVTKGLSVARRSEIVLFVLDVSKPFQRQDKFLAGEILLTKSSLIVIFNKWDKIEIRHRKNFMTYFARIFPFLTWAPKIFVSAKTGEHINDLFDAVLKAKLARLSEIPKNSLNKFLKKTIARHRPQGDAGNKRPYLHGLSQTGTNPPTFELITGDKVGIKQNYIKFMENQLREKFDLYGCQVKINVAQKKR
ncbi:ribosome biogenesis GTPase Der [Candidatus Parcubacteria bacterium]|nr:MAG: ribosome biogenesis GTPase Der [Candidatus Parcubacteria bacterium]